MRIIVVSSGKGGVGKTTVAIKLAYELNRRGHKTGLLDVDIDTPNLSEFIGERPQFDVGEMVNPVIIDGIEMASIGFMIDDSMCVTWDGAHRIEMIDELIQNVDWECDVLVIDTPPGTTEEMKHIIANYDPNGVVVVTTPHEASLVDVRRTLTLMKLLNARVVGVVVNMSGMVCHHCGNVLPLFSHTRDERELSKELKGAKIISSLPYWVESTKREDRCNQVSSNGMADAVKRMGDAVEMVI